MYWAAYVGFLTTISLILAIGAQNALILRQGLSRSHIFWPVVFCATSDAILILVGVFGLAAMSDMWPSLPVIMKWGGVIFLVAYGLFRLRDAIWGTYEAEIRGSPKPLAKTMGTLFVFTWLNPHVYLDTIGLIGAISVQFEQKYAFAIGAISASVLFFFSLGYGAKLLAPFFTSARVWRALDVAIAIIMFAIALSLVALH